MIFLLIENMKDYVCTRIYVKGLAMTPCKLPCASVIDRKIAR